MVLTVTAGNTNDENSFFEPFNVNQPADVTVCNGATTSAITFTSTVPGNTFTWTNNNTSIGLGASGSGNIAPFTAINTGTAPVVATITVTPASGTPATFTITVVNAANGNVIMSLPATTTSTIKPGRYVYDVKMTDNANTVTRIVEGIITVTPQVSR